MYRSTHCSVPHALSSANAAACPSMMPPAISREPDGTFNEDYCTWCYSNGTYTYSNMDDLLDYLVNHMATDTWPPDQVRTYFENLLPTLKHWQETE